MDVVSTLVARFDAAIIWYFLALNTFYGFLILLSIPEIWKHWKITHSDNLSRYLTSEALPPISVLMPAYNMEQGIIDAVRSQLTLRYPKHEVIVVNDGSRDQTLARMIADFDLYQVPPAIPHHIPVQEVRAYYRSRTQPSLLVIDKVNGGKADALNAAISAARYPLVVAVDADTIIQPDALLRLARTFVVGKPVAAAGGTIRVVNGCTIDRARVTRTGLSEDFLAAVQVPEYLRAFLFGRLGWNRLGGNLIVSGAFGLFQRRFLLEIGGYATGHVVEDLDLVIRLHKHLREQGSDHQITFIPDPVAWTEVPFDLRTLGRQRERWHRGLVKTMVTHRRMLFNPRYGRVGLVAFPFFFFGEMLAPVIELIGYIMTAIGFTIGAIDANFALMFLAVALGYQMLLSTWAIILEEATFRIYEKWQDFVRLLLYAFAEPFGYRQLTVVWRLHGCWNAMRGLTHWGEMQRRGFGPEIGSDGEARATDAAA
ncbi:MAG: glycosyltransferase [Gemmatimonadota bacterium]|nr:glycosyltransferase [Gemmatimonadota bacterium]